MANRLKEEEKNERIIRSLLKLPVNRRCINCNSLGPQYVCTNFSTFVCTTCSGIHREFTHRVKSISMAKFTSQEVSALQGGGNASAREIYLKEWDPQRNSLPDGSNIDRLRDFIKHVYVDRRYVDRRYTGERSSEKPPRAKMEETEDFGGIRRTDTYQGGSRSPPYDDTFERRQGDRPSAGGRSPAADQDSHHNSDYQRSPARVEVVNDWRREDRFRNGRRSEDQSSDGGSKLEIRSPDSQRSDMSSPPMIRPVRDILGENVSPLRVIEPPKALGGKSTDGSTRTQRTASSSSLASSDANLSETKGEASFIDFDSVPEHQVTIPQTQQAPGGASSGQLTAPNNNNWANFDSVPEVKATTAASNPMESLLSELSISAPTSGPSTPASKLSLFQPSSSRSSFGSSFGSIAPPSVLPQAGGPAALFGPALQSVNAEGSFLINTHTGGQWPTMAPQPHSMFPAGMGQPVSQLITPVIDGSSSDKSWNPLVPNAHGPPGASTGQVGQAAMDTAKETTSGFTSKSSLESNSGGRKALPEDLFTMNYTYTRSPAAGWYPGSYVSGVPMQYNAPMAPWAVPNLQPASSRPTNPFDVSSEPPAVQASTFPSVASLEGGLPKSAPPSGLMRMTSLGTPPHPPLMAAQAPSYASAIPPSSYVGQEIAGGFAPRPQGLSGFSFEESAFALDGLYPGRSASNNFTSASGNPFG